MTDEREIQKDPTLITTRRYDKINPEQLPTKAEASNVDKQHALLAQRIEQ